MTTYHIFCYPSPCQICLWGTDWADGCLQCHHSPAGKKKCWCWKINTTRIQIDNVKRSWSRLSSRKCFVFIVSELISQFNCQKNHIFNFPFVEWKNLKKFRACWSSEWRHGLVHIFELWCISPLLLYVFLYGCRETHILLTLPTFFVTCTNSMIHVGWK